MTLYVRALSPISLSTSQTGTGTEFKLDQNSSKLLPLWVAQEAGFQRLWTAGKVQVATDSGFSNVVTSIPAAETETVTTVNGYAGAVTLAASDVGQGPDLRNQHLPHFQSEHDGLCGQTHHGPHHQRHQLRW